MNEIIIIKQSIVLIRTDIGTTILGFIAEFKLNIVTVLTISKCDFNIHQKMFNV